MTEASDVERDMRIEVLDRYKRHGDKCRFDFRLSGFGTLHDKDGEPYVASFHWAYCRWDGRSWHYESGMTHKSYPVPREPTQEELLSALRMSTPAARAISSMGGRK